MSNEVIKSRTFGIIKPDATARRIEFRMMDVISHEGFAILATIRRKLTREETEWLYREHKDKEWFPDQVNYMLSGEVILMVLEFPGEDAAAEFRTLMGPTDRTKAAPNTLRGLFAVGYRENSIHGSDGPVSAVAELDMFFPEYAL